MTDYREITWEDFYAARIPTPSGLGQAGSTGYALAVLRGQLQQAGAELLGSFMKWGMPVIKDLVAFAFFTDCMQAVGDSERAMHAVRRPLDSVDWDFIEKLLSDGAEKYKEHMRNESHDAHQLKGFLDGLEYAMAGKLPGVEKPGDLFERVMHGQGSN